MRKALHLAVVSFSDPVQVVGLSGVVKFCLNCPLLLSTDLWDCSLYTMFLVRLLGVYVGSEGCMLCQVPVW